jgi:hypothetical protein
MFVYIRDSDVRGSPSGWLTTHRIVSMTKRNNRLNVSDKVTDYYVQSFKFCICHTLSRTLIRSNDIDRKQYIRISKVAEILAVPFLSNDSSYTNRNRWNVIKAT